MNRTEHKSQDEIKKMRRGAYIKIVAAVGFIAAVLAYGTISWFTMNKENNASGMGVKVKGQSFLVESIPEDANHVSGVRGSFYQGIHTLLHVPEDQIWLMLNDENMENYGSTAEGIYPGSEGQISFYITPLVDAIDVDYTFEITGYQAVETESPDPIDNANTIKTITGLTEIDSDDETNGEVANLLNGHILLFSDRDGSSPGHYTYKGFLGSDSNMERILKNVHYTGVNTRQKVTFYWVWPKTLSRLVEISPSENISVLCNKTILYDNDGNVTTDTVTGKTTYQRVIAHIEQNPQYYMKDVTGTVQESNLSTHYIDYGDKFDLADNRIGATVDYVVLKMTVTDS